MENIEQKERELKKRIYDLENQVEWFKGTCLLLAILWWTTILYLG